MVATICKVKTYTEGTSKFRDSMGRWYTRALFLEMTLDRELKAVLYTLEDQDKQGYPSLYRLYMEKEDVSEFEFAKEYLGSYEHWELLCRCPWFKDRVARYRKELELKLRARYLAKLMADAEDPTSKTSTTSAKYLIEKGWDKEPTKRRGRPNKDNSKELESQAIEEAQILEQGRKLLNVN